MLLYAIKYCHVYGVMNAKKNITYPKKVYIKYEFSIKKVKKTKVKKDGIESAGF